MSTAWIVGVASHTEYIVMEEEQVPAAVQEVKRKEEQRKPGVSAFVWTREVPVFKVSP